MPRGPKGEKRPADVIGNAVHVMRIATGELEEDHLQDQGCDCGEHQRCQDIYNPGRAPPAALLALP